MTDLIVLTHEVALLEGEMETAEANLKLEETTLAERFRDELLPQVIALGGKLEELFEGIKEAGQIWEGWFDDNKDAVNMSQRKAEDYRQIAKTKDKIIAHAEMQVRDGVANVRSVRTLLTWLHKQSDRKGTGENGKPGKARAAKSEPPPSIVSDANSEEAFEKLCKQYEFVSAKNKARFHLKYPAPAPEPKKSSRPKKQLTEAAKARLDNKVLEPV